MKSTKLAEQILSVLEHENPRDAINALKIAMILLPIEVRAETSRPQCETLLSREELPSEVR